MWVMISRTPISITYTTKYLRLFRTLHFPNTLSFTAPQKAGILAGIMLVTHRQNSRCLMPWISATKRHDKSVSIYYPKSIHRSKESFGWTSDIWLISAFKLQARWRHYTTRLMTFIFNCSHSLRFLHHKLRIVNFTTDYILYFGILLTICAH